MDKTLTDTDLTLLVQEKNDEVALGELISRHSGIYVDMLKKFGYNSLSFNQISDIMQDNENYLKAFALLKNPVFAELMESTESVHRSFAEVMKDHGEEKMMFGILDMIKDFGGLVGFQEETQINQNNSSVNIRA